MLYPDGFIPDNNGISALFYALLKCLFICWDFYNEQLFLFYFLSCVCKYYIIFINIVVKKKNQQKTGKIFLLLWRYRLPNFIYFFFCITLYLITLLETLFFSYLFCIFKMASTKLKSKDGWEKKTLVNYTLFFL